MNQRQRACLKCEKSFKSKSKFNRLCKNCKHKNQKSGSVYRLIENVNGERVARKL